MEKLPDNTELSEAREYSIKTGYDHYWRFHDKAEQWAHFGCPLCSIDTRDRIRHMREEIIFNGRSLSYAGLED